MKSDQEPSSNLVIEQRDNVSHKIFIRIDSIQQISINGSYVPADSLGNALQHAREAKKDVDPAKLLWVLEIHPNTKMGAVVDVKTHLSKMGDAKIQYEKSP